MFIPDNRSNLSKAFQTQRSLIEADKSKSHIWNELNISDFYDIPLPNEGDPIKNLEFQKRYAKWSMENQNPTNLLSKNMEYQIDFQVTKIVVSPDGNSVAYSLKDNSLVICNRFELFKMGNNNLRMHSQPITNLVFSHNSEKLASFANDKLLLIWNVTNKKVIKEIQQTERSVSAFAFGLKNDELCAYANYGGSLFLMKSGKELFVQRKAHDKPISQIGYTKSDRLLLTGSSIDSIVKLWIVNGIELKSIQTIQNISIMNNMITNNFFIAHKKKTNEIKLWKNNDSTLNFEERKIKTLGRDIVERMFLFHNDLDDSQACLFVVYKKNIISYTTLDKFDNDWEKQKLSSKTLTNDIKTAYFKKENDEEIVGLFFSLDKNFEEIRFSLVETKKNLIDINKLKKLDVNVLEKINQLIPDETPNNMTKKINNFSESKPNFISVNARIGPNLSEINLKKKPVNKSFLDEIPKPKKFEEMKKFEPLPSPSIEINKKKKVLQRKYSFEKNEEGAIKNELDLALSPKKKKKGSIIMKNNILDGNLSENDFESKLMPKKLQENPSQAAKQKEEEKSEDPVSIYPFYQDTSVVLPDLLVVSNNFSIVTVEGKKNYVSIWNLFDKSFINKIIFSSSMSVVKFMVFSMNGKYFGAFDQDYEIKIYDSILKTVKTINHNQKMTSIHFSYDNSFLIVADKLNNLSFYDIESSTLSKTFNMSGIQQQNLVTIAPLKDNESILLGTEDGKLMLFKEKKGNQILEEAIQIFDVIIFSGTHNEKIKFLSASDDSNFCIVASDSIIRFWNLETKFTKDFIDTSENKENTKVKYTSIALTSHAKKLAAGNTKGDIIIWSCLNPDIPAHILIGAHLAPIYSVEFADQNNNIISKSIDCIKKWRLFKQPNEMDFSQSLCYSSNCLFEILSESEILNNSQKYYLNNKEKNKKSLINLPVPSSKLNLSEIEVNPIQEMDIQQVKEPLLTVELQPILNVEDKYVKFAFFNKRQLFLLAIKKNKPDVYFYDYEVETEELSSKSQPIINSQLDELLEIKISPTDHTILLIGKSVIEVWNKKDKEKEEYVALLFNLTVGSTIQIEFIENKFLLILNEDKSLQFIDLHNGVIGTGGLDNVRINYFYFSEQQSSIYLLTETSILRCRLYSVDYLFQCESILVENVKSFFISKASISKVIYQNLNNDICACLSGLTFEYTYVLKKNQKNVTYYLNEMDHLVIVSKDKKLKIFKNPFKNERFLLKNCRYFSFFYDVLNNKKKNLTSNEEKDFFDIGCGIKGIIIPFYQTFFHKIALIRDEDAFEKFCGKINTEINLDAFFKKDINEMSCLEILFQQKNNTFVTKIILYWVNHYKIDTLFKQYKKNFYEYINFAICNKLIHLFKEDTLLLNTLFTFLFQSPLKATISLPKLENDFLLVVDDPKITVDVVKELLGLKLKADNSLEYAFVKVLYVANATEREYNMNLDFLRQLTTLEPTNLIFSNEALINLINCKWSAYGWKYFFLEFSFYLFYCIIYILQSSFILWRRIMYDDNHDYIVVSYIFDIFCLTYIFYNICHEIYQIYKLRFLSYFTSFWNIIDVILFYLSFAAIILDLVNLSNDDYNLEQLKLLYSISMFFCFLRLLSYARGIKGSAFMIRLILQVFIDIKYFVALIIIFIIGLAISGYDLQKYNEDSYSFFKSFNAFYRVMIGDLGFIDDWNSDFSFFLYFLYYAASIVLAIVMLNLLIAIISDTYGNVTKNEGKTRIYEMCNILYELDSTSLITLTLEKLKKIKCCKRYAKESNEKKNKFLVHIYNESKKEKTIEEKIENLNSNLELLEKKIDSQFSENKIAFNKIETLLLANQPKGIFKEIKNLDQ